MSHLCISFIFYYSWTHQSSPNWASFFLSHEWQFSPSRSDSLISTTIFPRATLKHVPFALQFVQPGIITTSLNPSLKHSSGSVPSLTFSAPSTVAFCSFCVQSVFVWQKSKGQSVILPTQLLGKVTLKQSTAVTYMCTRAHNGQIQGV